jgi:hypothetical protein
MLFVLGLVTAQTVLGQYRDCYQCHSVPSFSYSYDCNFVGTAPRQAYNPAQPNMPGTTPGSVLNSSTNIAGTVPGNVLVSLVTNAPGSVPTYALASPFTNEVGTVPSFTRSVSTNSVGTVPSYGLNASTNSPGTVPSTSLPVQRIILGITKTLYSVKLVVQGPPRAMYTLRASEDLKLWRTIIDDGHFSPTGVNEIVLQMVQSPGQHFFRLAN